MENSEIFVEEALKNVLESGPGLTDRVCPVADILHSEGPLAVYEQKEEAEENAMDGLTGLATAVFTVHVLHNTYERMRLLSEQVKRAVQTLRQSTYGSLCIEETTVKLATPDIYELRVDHFRRSYQVTIQYQIKEDK